MPQTKGPDWRADYAAALSSPDQKEWDRARALKASKIPSHLFRYRKPTESSFRGLREGTIWLSAANQFNDLHDTSVSVDPHLGFGVAIWMRLFKNKPWFKAPRFLLAFVGRLALWTADRTFELAVLVKSGREDARKVKGFFTRILTRMSTDLVTQITTLSQQKTKVACFSEVEDAPLMWAHYAESHQGFCIEYPIEDLGDDGNDLRRRWLLPIIYSKERFDLFKFAAQSGGRVNPHAIWLASIHKSLDWAYEREWRIIDNVGDDAPGRAMLMPTPSRIILGHRMKEEDRKTVIEIARTKGIPIFETVPSTDSFTLATRPVLDLDAA